MRHVGAYGGSLWIVCWRFPVLSETIVATEYVELRRQGFDALLVPLMIPDRAGDDFGIGEDRVLRAVPTPKGIGGRLLLLWRIFRLRPTGFVRMMARAVGFVGDDIRGDIAMASRVADAAGGRLSPRHLHAQFTGQTAHVASLLASYYGCGWSVTAHAKDIYSRPDRLSADFATASFVRTISDNGREWVLRHCPKLNPGRVVLIHCGVEPDKFEFRSPMQPDRIPQKVVAVGRLVPKKGHDILVRSCRLLLDGGTDVRCMIVGNGPEAPRIRELIGSLNLQDRVFLREGLDRASLMQVIAEADVMALACRKVEDGDQDGIPLAFMEAMAMGKPVVSGAVGGIRDLLVRGGAVVDPVTPEGMAGALRAVFELPVDQYAELCAQARRQVEETFALPRLVGRLAELFRREGVPAG